MVTCPRCKVALHEYVADTFGNPSVRLESGEVIHHGCAGAQDKASAIQLLGEWLPIGLGITCPRCHDRLHEYAAFPVQNRSIRLRSGDVIHAGCKEERDVVVATKIRDVWVVKREYEGTVM